MDYESFFETVKQEGVEFSFDNSDETENWRLSNEALFHLPLLAVTILMLSKGHRKPKLDEIGQLVGECFERTFVEFRGSTQHLGWSANLRMRTVRALTFLETANLVAVNNDRTRITATILGRKVIGSVLSCESYLAIAMRKIERSYRNISAEQQISLGL